MSNKIDIIEFNQEQNNEILENYSIAHILYHYKLTGEFCVKYILDKEYQDEPKYDIYDILKYQQHLSLSDLQKFK